MPEGGPECIVDAGRVAVLRRVPSAAEWPGLFDGDPGTLLFLHGDAVVLAEAGRLSAVPVAIGPEVAVEVCASSWDRRYATEPDPGVLRGSLATMYRTLGSAAEILCIGCGGTARWHGGKSVDDAWLLEIAFAPADGRQARETLEFVLGAAALDLDARVLFRGPGYNQLLTEASRGWAQVTDFGLLELVGEVPDGLDLPVPVQRLTGEAIEQLLRRGNRRLVL